MMLPSMNGTEDNKEEATVMASKWSSTLDASHKITELPASLAEWKWNLPFEPNIVIKANKTAKTFHDEMCAMSEHDLRIRYKALFQSNSNIVPVDAFKESDFKCKSDFIRSCNRQVTLIR